MERGHNGNLSLVENIYSLEDPNLKYLQGMEPTRNGGGGDPAPGGPVLDGFRVTTIIKGTGITE